MKATLYLGVHKTATTYFQSIFENSRKELLKNYIYYVSLNEVRRKLTSNINKNLDVSLSDLGIPTNTNRVIISDENILGGLGAEIPVYPKAASRIKSILSTLPFPVDKIVIVVRDPESYLISKYCEYIKHREFKSIEQYFGSIDITKFSWSDLISRIKEITPTPVDVYFFEDIISNEIKLTYAITGLNKGLNQASPFSRSNRASITQELYDIVSSVNNSFGSEAASQAIKLLLSYKQENKPNKISFFSESTADLLKNIYEKDKLSLNSVII